MKTIKELLKKLPDRYKELALANIPSKQDLNEQFPTIRDAFGNIICWYVNEKWYAFWKAVDDYLLDRGPLPHYQISK